MKIFPAVKCTEYCPDLACSFLLDEQIDRYVYISESKKFSKLGMVAVSYTKIQEGKTTIMFHSYNVFLSNL